MPVTLAQARVTVPDDVTGIVIDEFRKSSYLLDKLTFEDVVNPAGGGATLTYGYARVVTPSTAGFRAINSEYTKSEAVKQGHTVELKPLGGAFEVDRVVGKLAQGREVSFQMTQKIKSSRAAFADAVINGDSGIDANSFDGLDVALAGTSTEVNATTITDLTGITTQAGAFAVMEIIDTWLKTLDERPEAILTNSKGETKLQSLARYAGYFSEREDAFGNKITQYNGIDIVDLGERSGSSAPVIPIESRDLDQAHYTVDITGVPTGGTFTITVNVNGLGAQTTTAIAYNATVGAVQSAIAALTNVGTGNVTVVAGTAGVEYDIVFGDDLDQVPVVLTSNGAGLTGGTAPAATTASVASNTASTGLTDLYAVRFGLDAVHGVSMLGSPLVQQWLPDFTTAGAVKTGEVELGPSAVVLKASRAAGVLRNLKVQ